MGFEAFDRVLGDTKFGWKLGEVSRMEFKTSQASLNVRESSRKISFFSSAMTICENMHCLGLVESINVTSQKNQIEQIEFIHANKKIIKSDVTECYIVNIFSTRERSKNSFHLKQVNLNYHQSRSKSAIFLHHFLQLDYSSAK